MKTILEIVREQVLKEAERIRANEFPRPFSTWCDKSDACVLQIGHEGKCAPKFNGGNS